MKMRRIIQLGVHKQIIGASQLSKIDRIKTVKTNVNP